MCSSASLTIAATPGANLRGSNPLPSLSLPSFDDSRGFALANDG